MLDDLADTMPEAVAYDCALLEHSGLFDSKWYRAQAKLDADANAAEHYLLHGWKVGLEPNKAFDGSFLYPYFRTIGFDGPPALSFITLRGVGWITYSSRADAEAPAAAIRD